MPNEVRKKKINAYPIPGQMVSALGPAKAQILKLTLLGFIAEIGESKIQAGDKLEMAFELPVVHMKVKELGVVVKLYNQFAPLRPNSAVEGTPQSSSQPSTAEATNSKVDRHGVEFGGVMHLAEIHFKPLSPEGRKTINHFLTILSSAPKGGA